MPGANSMPPVLAPPGFSVPARDAAPDSLLAQLRAGAQHKRETQDVVVELPDVFGVKLRARYGALSVEELERYVNRADQNTLQTISGNLEILARACRAIEGFDENDGKWWPLTDDIGPVTFDDRLARLLQWDRPADEFEFPVAQVFETMFGGNGFALMSHCAEVMQGLGIIEQEAGSLGESTRGGSTRSVSPPPTA